MGNFSYSFPWHGSVSVNSVEYVWKVKRYWGLGDNGKAFGLTITVYIENVIGKTLHIEFPFSEFHWSKQPTKQQLEER